MKSTWTDEESEGSKEEDDLASNQVAFFGSLVSYNYVFIQGRASVATKSVCLFANQVLLLWRTNQLQIVTLVQNLIVEISLKKTMSLYMRHMRKCMHNGLKFVPQIVP